MIKAAVELNDKDRKSIKEAVENAWQGEALAELQNYVRIPCKSKDFEIRMGPRQDIIRMPICLRMSLVSLPTESPDWNRLLILTCCAPTR